MLKALQNIETTDQSASPAYPAPVEFSDKNDETIWQAFKEGDEAAFIFIYRQYANLLYNYGAKFATDKDVVADCLQDFFLYLRKNRERLGRTNSIKLYLLKSFRRRVIEYVNKALSEKKKNKDALEFQLQVEVSHELKFIDAQAKEEQVDKLNEALENLNQKEREAVYFFYYEGLNYKEISELMGFTHVSSARRLIYRALNNLRNLFLLLIMFVAGLF